jgi:hypothetical protein
MTAIVAEFLGLAGAIILLVPAIRMNQLLRRKARIRDIQFSPKSDPYFQQKVDDLKSRLSELTRSWNWLDEACLFSGLLCLVLSYLIGFVERLAA